MALELVDEATLDNSAIVANNAMNRERGYRGANSYVRELRFDPLIWLAAHDHGSAAPLRWLDLCCGSGKALVEADALSSVLFNDRLTITGVDLVAPMDGPDRVEFIAGSLRDWNPSGRYDLITCVHGIHYVGDKFAMLQRISRWLTIDGYFAANFDAESIRIDNQGSSPTKTSRALRHAGFDYDARRKLLTRRGYAEVQLPFRFLGADDRAGPNYTGQPAVTAHYASISS
jgi:trans-aconitate methyltransferase